MEINDKVKAIIDLRPWLKIVLNVLYRILSYGKANELFVKAFGPK